MAGHERADVLAKLGALSSLKRDTSPAKASPSPLVDEVDDDWKWVTRSSDEDSDASPIVFDREELLGDGRKKKKSAVPSGVLRNRRTATTVSRPREAPRCKLLILCLAFVSLGLCTAIIGPTLPDIQANLNSPDLVPAVSLVSVGAFGAILIIVITNNLFATLNPLHIILCAVGVAVPMTLLIPFCTSMKTLVILFLMQGMCLGAIERGGLVILHAFFPQRFRLIHLVYLCLALGATISPLITTPFVFDNISETFTSQNPALMRFRRSINQSDNQANPLDRQSAGALFESKSLQGNEPSPNTTTTTAKPKRPNVAIGDKENPNKKTLENQLKREEVAEKSNMVATGAVEPAKPAADNATVTEPITATNATLLKTTVATTTMIKLTTKTTTVPPTSPTTTTTTPKTTTAPTKTTITNNVTTVMVTQLPTTITSKPFWQQVQDQVKQMNNVKLAYAIVSGLVLVSAVVILMAFCCCCVPMSVYGEDKVKELHMQTSLFPIGKRQLFYVVLLCATLSAIESNLATLLTIFSLDRNVAHFATQSDGAIHTSLYWLLVAVARFIFMARSDWGTSSRFMMIALILSTLSGIFLTIFGTQSRLLCLVGMAFFALFSGGLRPGVYCWILAETGLPGWRLSLLMLVSAGMGRLVGPLVTAAIIQSRGSSQHLIHQVLLLSVISLIVFFVLKRSIHSLVRQQANNYLMDSLEQGESSRTKKRNRLQLVDIDDDDGMNSDDDEQRLFGGL